MRTRVCLLPASLQPILTQQIISNQRLAWLETFCAHFSRLQKHLRTTNKTLFSKCRIGMEQVKPSGNQMIRHCIDRESNGNSARHLTPRSRQTNPNPTLRPHDVTMKTKWLAPGNKCHLQRRRVRSRGSYFRSPLSREKSSLMENARGQRQRLLEEFLINARN